MNPAKNKQIRYWIAAVFSVAILVVSCKNKMAQAEVLNLKDTPVQTIDDMFAVQTKNGLVVMRVEASVMERYDNDTTAYETFPKGIAIYGPRPTM